MIVDTTNLPALFGAASFDAAAADAAATAQMRASDYAFLGALALHTQPARIFEIGTFEGATSQFLLALLPAAHVVSIATLDSRFNTSYLTEEQIGCRVTARDRFTQLIGDSHALDADAFVAQHGRMNLVLVDGDHSREGAQADTELALKVLAPAGVIVWHDARHRRYPGVAAALQALPFRVWREGNVAAWSAALDLL